MKEQVIYGQSVLIIIILEMQQKFKASLAMLNTYKLVLQKIRLSFLITQVSGLTARNIARL